MRQTIERARFAQLPDHDHRRGELLALYTEDNKFNWRGMLWSLALCAGVIYSFIALKWAWFALGIPYPGR